MQLRLVFFLSFCHLDSIEFHTMVKMIPHLLTSPSKLDSGVAPSAFNGSP